MQSKWTTIYCCRLDIMYFPPKSAYPNPIMLMNPTSEHESHSPSLCFIKSKVLADPCKLYFVLVDVSICTRNLLAIWEKWWINLMHVVKTLLPQMPKLLTSYINSHNMEAVSTEPWNFVQKLFICAYSKIY